MKNVDMTVNKDILTIKIDLTQRLGKSESGKNMIVATTKGNQLVPGTDYKIGLNIYIKSEE